LIQRVTGEYMYMQQQLHNTIDDAEQTLYFLNGHGSQVLDFTGDYTFFIDIPFYSTEYHRYRSQRRQFRSSW